MANINGSGFLVSVAGTDLVDQTECSISMSSEYVSTATKQSGGFNTGILGQRSASISVSGLTNDTGSAAEVLMVHYLARTSFAVTFGLADSGSQDHSYSGNFFCTSFEESAGTEDTVTYSATFESTGAIALDITD